MEEQRRAEGLDQNGSHQQQNEFCRIAGHSIFKMTIAEVKKANFYDAARVLCLSVAFVGLVFAKG